MKGTPTTRTQRTGPAGGQAAALWKMEGYTYEEIPAKLGCVPRTVDRKDLRNDSHISERGCVSAPRPSPSKGAVSGR